ncbi:MAG TPA: hypothetical protein VNW52_00010 [Burkholderiaceae bacterium]|jgi:stage IV sporulation protein FB|nr:hypothetical protein [Burkholderiaceae bacterium]
MSFNQGYWTLGKWKNIFVYFHWTTLLWLPFYLMQGKSAAWIALSFPAFIFLLAAHEFGHAIAARSRRVKVYAIRLYVMHGLCEHEEPYYESDHVLIAWGGIFAQVVILLVALTLDFLLSWFFPQVRSLLNPIFFVLINSNFIIGAINLIPVKPLDGYVAWRVIPLLRNRWFPEVKLRLRGLKDVLNFKKRRAIGKESQRLATELMDRLKNK